MVASIEPLTRDDSSGSHAPPEVSVWADTGSANQHSATAMVNQRWPFRMARKKTRRGKSAALSLATPTSRPWCAVCTFFRHHRRGKWQPTRVPTHGATRKRMVLRTRDTMGSRRSVGQVQCVCSEGRHRPAGRRQSLAGSDLRGTARQILIGDRRRWAVALFHKQIKQHLGFAEVATSGCDAVRSQVSWVYGAYLWLPRSPPGVAVEAKSLGDKQRQLQRVLANPGQRRVIQKLTQMGGVERYKDALRQALADA